MVLAGRFGNSPARARAAGRGRDRKNASHRYCDAATGSPRTQLGAPEFSATPELDRIAMMTAQTIRRHISLNSAPTWWARHIVLSERNLRFGFVITARLGHPPKTIVN